MNAFISSYLSEMNLYSSNNTHEPTIDWLYALHELWFRSIGSQLPFLDIISHEFPTIQSIDNVARCDEPWLSISC